MLLLRLLYYKKEGLALESRYNFKVVNSMESSYQYFQKVRR